LIKEGQLDLVFLRDNIPANALIKNNEKIKNILSHLINRDSQRWNDEQHRDRYNLNYTGYANTATLAQLDSIYSYKMIPLWDSYVKDVLNDCIENYDEFQKRRFITANEFLRIAETCSNKNKKTREKAIYYIENTTDSGVVHYVNQNYSREKIISNFLENPSSVNLSYIRFLGDSSIISELVPYLISVRKGKDTDFAYFEPICNLLRAFFYDFDLKEKYFPINIPYNELEIYYDPQHYNRSFSKLYSENYMDFMKRYEKWIKDKFGKELKRKPQPDDILDKSQLPSVFNK